MVPNKNILKKPCSEKPHFYLWLLTLSSAPIPHPDQVTIPMNSGESFLCFLTKIKHMQVYLTLFPLIFII